MTQGGLATRVGGMAAKDFVCVWGEGGSLRQESEKRAEMRAVPEAWRLGSIGQRLGRGDHQR
jgi:hypothetical protein